MVKVRLWGSILLIVGLCQCASSPKTVVDVPVLAIDPDQPEMTQEEMVRHFTNDRLVVLRGAMLTSIDKIIDWGDRFVILDRRGQQAVIFDTTGNCIRQIKRLGKGPGEYVQIGSCAIDPTTDELVLYADQPGKFLWFDREGKYLREERTPECFFEFVCHGADKYAVNCGAGSVMSEGTVTRIDAAGERTTQLPNRSQLPSVSGGQWLSTNGSTAWLSRPFDYTLYALDGESAGEFTPRYRLDLGSAELSEDRIRSIVAEGLRNVREEGFVFHVNGVGQVGDYLFLRGIDLRAQGYMIDLRTDSVWKIGWTTVFGGPFRVGGCSLVDNQNRRIVHSIPLVAMEIWSTELKNKGESHAVLDSVLAANAEGMNPVLVFQDVK